MAEIVPLAARAAEAPAEPDVAVKLDQVLAKLERIERFIGAVIDCLPMRWRVSIRAAWHG